MARYNVTLKLVRRKSVTLVISYKQLKMRMMKSVVQHNCAFLNLQSVVNLLSLLVVHIKKLSVYKDRTIVQNLFVV